MLDMIEQEMASRKQEYEKKIKDVYEDHIT